MLTETDKEVKQAAFLNTTAAMPRVDPPRTPQNPEAQEVWPMTLQDAIKYRPGQRRGHPRHLPGCPGHPHRRLRADPPEHRAQRCPRPGDVDLGLRPGDPGDADRPVPVAVRRAVHHQHALGPERAAVQQRHPGRHVQRHRRQASRSSSTSRRGPFSTGLQKTVATGGTAYVTHNVNFAYSNSPANVYPGAYTTNTQLRFTQPLLGGTQPRTPAAWRPTARRSSSPG